MLLQTRLGKAHQRHQDFLCFLTHCQCACYSSRAALDELVELGHIDSTIDDSHYAIKTSHYPRSP